MSSDSATAELRLTTRAEQHLHLDALLAPAAAAGRRSAGGPEDDDETTHRAPLADIHIDLPGAGESDDADTLVELPMDGDADAGDTLRMPL